jgi:hypothetical protein
VDDDAFPPHHLEQLRRSIVMLAPGRPSGLDRDRALQLIEELQRARHQDRRYRELVAQLRALLASAEQP